MVNDGESYYMEHGVRMCSRCHSTDHDREDCPEVVHADIQQELTERARREHPRKLFCKLLDDYFDTLVRKELPSDIAVPRQTAIDHARLAIIKEYERYAGNNAAVDLTVRQRTERCLDNMRRRLSHLTCPKRHTSGVVHIHKDGTWWFWDETWVDELGPYCSEDEAKTACDEYANQVLGPQWSEPVGTRGKES